MRPAHRGAQRCHIRGPSECCAAKRRRSLLPAREFSASGGEFRKLHAICGIQAVYTILIPERHDLMTDSRPRPPYRERLARFAAETTLADLSDAARDRARWILAD